MSDDWDTVTRIGQKARGAGGGDRETRVKGKAALNAAFRTGGVSAQKKEFGTANSKADPEGQFLTKVANSDEIIKPKNKVVRKEFKTVIEQARKDKGWKQEDLARLCSTSASTIRDFEAGKEKPNQQTLGLMQRHLGIWLSESKLGEPKEPGSKKKKKEAEDKKAKGTKGEGKEAEEKAAEEKEAEEQETEEQETKE